MKRNTLPIAALCGIFSIFFSTASAQDLDRSTKSNSSPQANALSTGIEKSPKKDAESSTSESEALRRRVEANIQLSRYLSFNPGFSTDDPVDEDIPNGGRTRNRAFYFANRITPGGNFLIEADYLRWRTDYKGFRRGIDNRVNIFFQYGF